MSHLLQATKNTIGEMFSRISEILKLNGKDEGCFCLQLIAYRNYNAPAEELLIHSSFSSDSTVLRDFLQKVYAGYGWGNEAIEVAFAHVAEQEDVTSVILIGDAAANEKADVPFKKSNDKGLPYWQATQYSQDIYYEDELQKLIQKNIRVHTFYLADRAKTCFSKIAKISNGVCEMLDISQPKNGAESLIGVISEQVLAAVDPLLGEEYKKRYPRIVLA